MLKRKKRFTLIELLIVIAIILILIAIALPNFLSAQLRAKVTRVLADQRSTQTAIEAFRTERGVLLIDFWDDGSNGSVRSQNAAARWREKFGMVGRNPGQGGAVYETFEECFYPLTSPVAYMKSLALDPFHVPGEDVGFGGDETGQTYIYFDNDVLHPDKNNDDHGIDILENDGPGLRLFGIRPLIIEEFGLLSIGPDKEIGTSKAGGDNFEIRGLPYSPTNGTKSHGDIVTRSAGMI